MEQVMGTGGVFFKAADTTALGAWCRDNLGVPIEEEWGGAHHQLQARTPQAHRRGQAPRNAPAQDRQLDRHVVDPPVEAPQPPEIT